MSESLLHSPDICKRAEKLGLNFRLEQEVGAVSPPETQGKQPRGSRDSALGWSGKFQPKPCCDPDSLASVLGESRSVAAQPCILQSPQAQHLHPPASVSLCSEAGDMGAALEKPRASV